MKLLYAGNRNVVFFLLSTESCSVITLFRIIKGVFQCPSPFKYLFFYINNKVVMPRKVFIGGNWKCVSEIHIKND